MATKSVGVQTYARVRVFFKDRESLKRAVECKSASENPNGRGTLTVLSNENDHLKDLTSEFTDVLSDKVGNEECFNVVSKPMIDKVLEGYKALLIAYGQTGSGKTFTLIGAKGAGQMGLLPRTIHGLLEDKRCIEMKMKGFEAYSTTLQKIPLYDLFNPVNKFNFMPFVSPDEDEKTNKKAEMKWVQTKSLAAKALWPSKQGKTGINPLTQGTSVDITSIEDGFKYVEEAHDASHFAKTGKNPESSRGHTVYILFLRIANPLGDCYDPINTQFVVVDLAGSEGGSTLDDLPNGADKTARFLEGGVINYGLTALKDMFSEMRKHGRLKNFQGNGLRKLLYPFVTSNTYMSIVFTLSPSSDNRAATRATMKFAQDACKLKMKPAKGKGKENFKKMYEKLKLVIEEKNKIISDLTNELENAATKIVSKTPPKMMSKSPYFSPVKPQSRSTSREPPSQPVSRSSSPLPIVDVIRDEEFEKNLISMYVNNPNLLPIFKEYDLEKFVPEHVIEAAKTREREAVRDLDEKLLKLYEKQNIDRENYKEMRDFMKTSHDLLTFYFCECEKFDEEFSHEVAPPIDIVAPLLISPANTNGVEPGELFVDSIMDDDSVCSFGGSSMHSLEPITSPLKQKGDASPFSMFRRMSDIRYPAGMLPIISEETSHDGDYGYGESIRRLSVQIENSLMVEGQITKDIDDWLCDNGTCDFDDVDENYFGVIEDDSDDLYDRCFSAAPEWYSQLKVFDQEEVKEKIDQSVKQGAIPDQVKQEIGMKYDVDEDDIFNLVAHFEIKKGEDVDTQMVQEYENTILASDSPSYLQRAPQSWLIDAPHLEKLSSAMQKIDDCTGCREEGEICHTFVDDSELSIGWVNFLEKASIGWLNLPPMMEYIDTCDSILIFWPWVIPSECTTLEIQGIPGEIELEINKPIIIPRGKSFRFLNKEETAMSVLGFQTMSISSDEFDLSRFPNINPYGLPKRKQERVERELSMVGSIRTEYDYSAHRGLSEDSAPFIFE